MVIQPKSNKNVLVIAPHTDDGELGAGGAMQVLIEKGYTIYHVPLAAPHGIDRLKAFHQCEAASLELSPKIKVWNYLQFETRNFAEQRQEILQTLCDLKKEIAPVIVFTTSSNDFHQDHEVVYKETIRAFKKDTTILGYDFPWNQLESKVNYFIPLNMSHMQNKIEALQCYSQEYNRCEQLHMTAVGMLAKTRGLQFSNGNKDYIYAEAFEFIKGGIID